MVLPWWLSGKESACNAGDPGLIPGSGRSSRGGNGNLLQDSSLEKPMDRGAWWATVSVQFSSVAQSCPTLCDPMNCSTPGLPVHHQLPESTQTDVHPAISSSVVPISFCPQSLPASGSFQMSQLFASGYSLRGCK